MARVHVVTLNTGNVRVELAMFREWLTLSEQRHDLVMRYSPGAGFVRYADGRLEPWKQGDYREFQTRPISANRNKIAAEFLDDAEAEFLLMMDSDQMPQFNPLDFVENDLDVLGWPSPTCRINDADPVPWFPRRPVPGAGIIHTEYIAGGCMLIARRVLEAIKHPFAFRYRENGLLELSEDIDFCIKAREAGFTVWVDLEHHQLHWKIAEMGAIWKWKNT